MAGAVNFCYEEAQGTYIFFMKERDTDFKNEVQISSSAPDP